ncbi:DNA-binding transcriptional regulator [Acrocarpospora macrocephala]|uniref:XylR family transcriptional regulator n=1 Tax=Acrocarpospora macrocephala TaxID=150177 RepID=A0A5M3WP41_9ACTN|nr:DNA-binding transcriptional regulator [Acrocarpospora macrocephala]GES11095.1 XylR family transcriptional regulator [Acrocarpospora macrocephala]
MRSSQPRQVALIIETSNQYARGLLEGVRRFVAVRPDWSMYFAEHSRLEIDYSWLEEWEGDGILARIENRECVGIVRRLGLPTVDLSAARLAPELPGVETDDASIASWAIDHFAERGLRNFAFCGDPRFGWSQHRGASYRRLVLERGATPFEYAMTPSGRCSIDRSRLAQWIASLPKPVGVMACYDIAGLEVLEACKIARVAVPDEVAVLGVDNDELIGNLSSPPLSSIEPDARGAGFLAARLLDEMMDGAEVPPEQQLLKPLRVVTRQSSDVLSVEDVLVARSLRFIRQHAHENISTDTVRRHVGLSRGALDRRFLNTIGRTTHAEITRARMTRVTELLSSTDLTLQQISDRLDFTHVEYLSVAFKRHTGKTPSEYRRLAK